MKVTALQHKDVRGNDMWYLKIENNGKEYLMNVGKKTYDTITEMTKEPENPNQTKIPLEAIDEKLTGRELQMKIEEQRQATATKALRK